MPRVVYGIGILRALACVEEPMAGPNHGDCNVNSFELFGFDILLDAELRPWYAAVLIHS
jgi:hypothetical protein